MKHLLTIISCFAALSMSAQTDYPFPWNPDADLDGWVSTEDLLQLLTVFGTQFEPDTWETDSISAAVVLDGNHNYFQCQSYCNDIEGNWRMADLDAFGRHFDLASSVSAYFWVNGNDKLNSSDFAYDTYQLYGPTGDMANVSVSNFSQAKKCMCYIQSSPFVPSQFTEDSNLALWGSVSDLQEQVDSLQTAINILSDNNSADSVSASEGFITLRPRFDSIACIEMGAGFQCAPQGGICDSYELGLNGQNFRITTGCATDYDPSTCAGVNWRKFRVYGANLIEISEVQITRWMASQNGYGYPSATQWIKSASIVETNSSYFDFYVGTRSPGETVPFITIGEEWGSSAYNDFGILFSLSCFSIDEGFYDTGFLMKFTQ